MALKPEDLPKDLTKKKTAVPHKAAKKKNASVLKPHMKG